MKLLWAYSLLLCIGLIAMCLLDTAAPSHPVSVEQASQDSRLASVMLMPVALFVVLTGIQNFKR
jgi:hypothetical protein